MRKVFNSGRKLTKEQRLSQERTLLSIERSSLSYVRTGFAAFILGLALIKLLEDNLFYVYTGYGSLVLGMIFIIVGVMYYPKRKKMILKF